jgi:hypothetical protein
MADIRKLKRPPRRDGLVPVAKTAAYTVKPQESGSTFYFNSSTAFAITLPKITKQMKGYYYTFVIKTATGAGTHSLAPASTDAIALKGVISAGTSVVGTTNTAGDTIQVECDGTNWVVPMYRGTWT